MFKPTVPAALLLLGLAACGDDTGPGPNLTPDAPVDPDPIPAVTPGCEEIPQPANAFETGAGFGPAVAGTLAGWDYTGRWFATGIKLGNASGVHLAPGDAGKVVFDRDTSPLGTASDTDLFHRYTVRDGPVEYIVAKRISNLHADGTARIQRAVCDGGACRVCTAKLERAARHDAAESDKLALVGELRNPAWDDGFTFNVRVRGTIAYLIREDGLHIIQTSDPANPTELGSWRRQGFGYSNDVKIVDTATKRYAIIADTPVDIVDVTDPTQPTFVTNIPIEAHTLFVEERGGVQYAIFGGYDGNAQIWNVTNPASPTELGNYRSGGSIVHDLNVENGIGYLNAWEAGFQVVDYTNPAQPTKLGTWMSPRESTHSSWTTTVNGRHIAMVGDEDYGAHLTVIDVDPASGTFMAPLGEYKTRDNVSIHNIMAFGSKAYFTYYQDGVRVLDLSDPTQPVLAGYYNTWDPQADYTSSQFFEGAVGLDVDLDRKLIFVADSPRGLLILRDDTL